MDTYRVKQVFKRALLCNTLDAMKEALIDGYEEFILGECKVNVCGCSITATSYNSLNQFCELDGKIPAIRFLREQNKGLGLKEAKEIVEHELYERGTRNT
jgi:hypothetical protein